MGRCGPSCSPYNGLLRWTFLLLVFGSSLSQAGTVHRQDDEPVTYTDQWAVHIEGGQQVADEIARRNDFINLGKIVGDYYHFQHRKLAKRSTEAAANHEEGLNSESQVRWIKQQVVKHRIKRDLIDLDPPPNSRREERSRDQNGQGGTRASRRAGSSAIRARSVSVNLNDPRWTQMWYLNRGMGLDMNVQEAWAEGVTGRGIVVTILDDGLEKDHPDIRRNYDPQASYDVNGHDDDPMPRYDLIDSNRHGTRCAGEVAAEGNNSICAVGVAYDAGIGGVRMLDGDVTDAVEARSLSLNPHHIDIYSASWGPDDDGKTVDGPGELATRAFIEGVTKGRSGKGSIFVWASGNGGRDHDNCNCDGYTNSIWTLSISSATENGYVPWYSEACSSTLATTYSSGSSGEKQIVTTDLHHSCTASHTGTSASAPLAAGICALALEANRNLTWRDMQHIVVRTAKPANLKADDWQVNGVGRNVSHSFGYGLMDAAAMVRVARVWNTVPPQQFCEIRAPDSNKLIPAKSQVQIQLHVSECSGVNYMEHVQARITLAAVSRGDIQIHLSSPFGTRSTLLALRPHDSSRNGFHSWPFMSVHYWGESPFGVWTLEIQNEGRYLGRANLQEWVLRIHGTRTDPGRSMRSSSTGGSSGRGSQGQSTSATLSKASNGPPSSISNQKAITTPLAMLTPTSAVVTIPAANESVVSIPVIPGSGTTATWDPSGTAAAKDGGSNQGQVKGGHNMDVGPRHDSVLRSKTATLSEWNVVIYGTKENPDAKNRAAAPALPSGIGIVSNNLSSASAASSAPATTSSSAKLQPNVDKELSRLNDADRLEGGFINRKPSLHQNLEENRASVFTNPESPVPVLSSASSSAASRCLPTHWDPTAAICLSTSLVSLLLHSDWLWLIWSLWRRISRLRPRPAPTSLSSPSSSAWLAR